MDECTRRGFLKGLTFGAGAALAPGCAAALAKKRRPNILFALADDWSWPHAGVPPGQARVVRTPAFDRVVREGVLFTNAFVASPSCTPSRAAILTGQWHWRLEESANLWSTLQARFPVYPDVLEEAGYHVGHIRKGWGPGRIEPGGRSRNPAGPRYKSFKQFLDACPAGRPFCFWFGSHDPHRGYRWKSGVQSGMRLEDVQVPSCLPDCEEVRTDLCDYYWEVQRFDREVGGLLRELERRGLLDNTVVVVSGDNGLPFPRCKSNLYDGGTHVPLAVRWGAEVKGGRVVEDFVSLADLAPTFLEAGGFAPLPEMTARSLLGLLLSGRSGQVEAERDHVLTGKERHTQCQEKGTPGGYPCRAIRTRRFLYIHNFKPDRWPAGVPEAAKAFDGRAYRDVDGSPTKTYMTRHRDDPKVAPLFELGFGKRPAEELYDLEKDPGQLKNVAGRREYVGVKEELAERLMEELAATKDPRVLDGGDAFETYPYYGG